MKSIYFHLVVFSLVSITLRAQELPHPQTSPWGWGVFVGVTLNHPLIETRFPEHFKPFPGFMAGVDVTYRTNNRTALHGQLSIARVINGKLGDELPGPIYDLITLKIPLSYRYYVLPNHHTLFIEAGAGYNHIVKSRYRENLNAVCITGPCPQWYSPELPPLSKLAVSGMAGVGIDIPVNKVTIPILIRYERYLSNYEFLKRYDNAANRIKFQSISLTTGVNF